jgi:hypothetical protein
MSFKTLNKSNKVKVVFKVISIIVAIFMIGFGIYEIINTKDLYSNKLSISIAALYLVTSVLKNPPIAINIILNINQAVGLINQAINDNAYLDLTYWIAIILIILISVGGYLKIKEE